MKNTSHLDEALNTSLYDYEVVVPDAAWSAMDAALDKKSKNKKVFLWIGFVVLMSGMLGTFWAKMGKIELPETTVNYKAPTNPSLKFDLTSKNSTANNPQFQCMVGSPEWLKENTKGISPAIQKNRIPKFESIEENFTNSTPISIQSKAVEQSLFGPTIRFKPNLYAKLSAIESSESYVSPHFVKKNKPSKLRWDGTVSAGLGFFKVNQIQMPGLPEISQYPAGFDGKLTAVRSANLQGNNWNYGIGIRYHFSDKFYLRSGLYIQHASYTLHYVEANAALGYTVKDGFIHSFAVEIPAIGGLNIFDKNKGKIYVEGGMHFIAGQTATGNIYDIEKDLQKNVKLNQKNALFTSGIQFEYAILNEMKFKTGYQMLFNTYRTTASYGYQIGGVRHQINLGIGFRL